MNRKETDSSWEAARQKRRKRIQSFFFFFLPLAIILAIILNNNRDLLNDGHLQTVKKNNLPVVKEPPVVRDSESVNSRHAMIRDSVKVSQKAPEPCSTQKSKTVLSLKTGTDSGMVKTSIDKNTGSKKKEDLTAVQPVKSPEVLTASLPGIECWVNDRKDLRIILDLEVQFSDELMRKEILLKRDDLKVLVKKTLSKKNLGEVKKEQLRVELTDVMNGIFDHRTITGTVIKNLQIEKAVKP